jgi:rubrerythrin
LHSFIQRENLKRYRNLLQTTSDEAVRSQLVKLIAEEERRLFLQRILEKQSTVHAATVKP